MRTDRIAEIIRALLVKAESTTFEGERASLLEKAGELLEKYQMGLEDLLTDDPLDMLEGFVGQPGMSMYKPMVQRALARYYGCRTVMDYLPCGKRFVNRIFGTQSSLTTLDLMSPFVWGHVLEQGGIWSRAKGKPSSHGTREVAKALVARLHDLTAERTSQDVTGTSHSLVVVDALKSHVARYFEGAKIRQVGRTSVTFTPSAEALAAKIPVEIQIKGKPVALLS